MMKTINLDGQKAEDRGATDTAAHSLSKGMTGNMNALVEQCQGNVFQLRCIMSLLDQLIDCLTAQRTRVQAMIKLEEGRLN